MQIGVFINNEWLPGILKSNTQGLIIKTEQNTMIINFKEIISCRINEQKFIELFYITMKNAETFKTHLTINSEDIDKTYEILTTVPVDEVVDPQNRFKVVEKEEIKNTQEFIDKQKELTKNNVKPVNETPSLLIAIIILLVTLFIFIIYKNINANTKSNLNTLYYEMEHQYIGKA